MLLPLVLCSCGIFTSIDPTPVLVADNSREQVFAGLADAFDALVERAEGWTAEQKRRVRDEIDRARDEYRELAARERAFLMQVGAVDWSVIATQAVELYERIKRAEDGEATPEAAAESGEASG